jgi:hypothetical protein
MINHAMITIAGSCPPRKRSLNTLARIYHDRKAR